MEEFKAKDCEVESYYRISRNQLKFNVNLLSAQHAPEKAMEEFKAKDCEVES